MLKVTPDEAVSVVQSGHRVFVHEAAMVPQELVAAFCRRTLDLSNIEVVHLHTEGGAPYVAPEYEGHVRHNALFVGANVREAVQQGRADFTPVFLSEVPQLFPRWNPSIDVALVQVSPPDEHGFCRLGVSVAAARAAVDHARFVIAELNPNVPCTMGHSALHISQIHAAVEVAYPLPQAQRPVFGEVETDIGRHIAHEIPHGATLQMGIGAIPDAVLAALHEHRDLGVHTEMFSEGLIDLIVCGAVTCRLKPHFPGRVVASFAVGTERLYQFVSDNPFVEFHPSDVVNDPRYIAKQRAMMAINSAIEVDLTGQVCADSLGDRIYSGIGGQMDFMRGALRSVGGKAFIALPSTAKGWVAVENRSSVETRGRRRHHRGHVQYVVTEFGAVNLRGRSLRERAELLISIAHPDHRAELRAAARQRNIFFS